jgi:hypothetical protein
MKKVSAVDWHFNAITEIYNRYIGGEINFEELLQNLLNSWLQARKMERDQIIEAHDAGFEEIDGGISEQYYNETYGK